MNELQQEAFDAVEKINYELFERYGDDYENDMPIVSVSFASYMTLINLSISDIEFNLYLSEEDDRIYYEENDAYETFYDFIKRKFNLIKEEINKVNL